MLQIIWSNVLHPSLGTKSPGIDGEGNTLLRKVCDCLPVDLVYRPWRLDASQFVPMIKSQHWIFFNSLNTKRVCFIYRLIHKLLRDFRPLRCSSRDGHAEGEYVNRVRDTPSFCPILRVLDMSTLGDAANVNPVIKFPPHTLHCVVGTWLQDWHLPRHEGWTYWAFVR